MGGYREMVPKGAKSVLRNASMRPQTQSPGYREVKKNGKAIDKQVAGAKDKGGYVKLGKVQDDSKKGKSMIQQSAKSAESGISSDSTAMPGDYKAPELLIDPRYLVVSETNGSNSDQAAKGKSLHHRSAASGHHRIPFYSRGHDPRRGSGGNIRKQFSRHGVPHVGHQRLPPSAERSERFFRNWFICLFSVLIFVILVGVALAVFFYFKNLQTADQQQQGKTPTTSTMINRPSF